MNEPHPVEALKLEVYDLVESIPSRSALRKRLIADGHPAGLVDAAIQSVFDERLDAGNRAMQKQVDAKREAQLGWIVGDQQLDRVRELGVGDPVAADNITIISALLPTLGALGMGAAAVAVGMSRIVQIHGMKGWAVAGTLFLAGVVFGVQAIAAWRRSGTIGVICPDALVEIQPNGDLVVVPWEDVKTVVVSKTHHRGRRGRYLYTSQKVSVYLQAGGKRVYPRATQQFAASANAIWSAFKRR